MDVIKVKLCSMCHVNPARIDKYGHSTGYCLDCFKSRAKKYKAKYVPSPTSKAKRNANTRVCRLKRLEAINSIKDQPCVDCEQRFHWCQMHFDHLDPTKKVNTVSRLVRGGSLAMALDEIKKCELVCANCHAMRTYLRANKLNS